MSFKDLFTYVLIETKEFDITVYEVLMVVVIVLTTMIISRTIRRVFRSHSPKEMYI